MDTSPLSILLPVKFCFYFVEEEAACVPVEHDEIDGQDNG